MMADPDLQRIKEVFSGAMELDPAARAAYLDTACKGDPALRRKIERMLKAHDQDLLGTPTRTESLDMLSPGEAVGDMIGRYRLLEHIGSGGFGDVYMAEQREPIRRKVALKVIKLGMDTRQVIARFEAERQALAIMDHPNIARVLDAGATSAGRPYFVMELVRGVPITRFCVDHKLDLPARLDLFMQVCGAVQHAHQKGIIHRDLKPSNVLITLNDGTPAPKVIDFGIAKAMHRELTDKTLFTEFRQFVGTPEYMSPEQAATSGIDIDTRSDVYALGVLLYELLTGVTPFDPRLLREAALAEIQRIITEVEPPRPSTRLSALTSGSSDPQAANAMRDLTRRLSGDLDSIVMKSLEKDRRRRYETASALAADVNRYLHDEPVTAAPPSRMYRLRKLVRRNRGAFVAASLVLAVLVLGIITTSAGLVWALRERGRANEHAATVQRQAIEVQQQADIATAVNAFLNDDLLAAVSPSAERGRGHDVTMREVLDVAAERIDAAAQSGGSMAKTPLVEAAVRYTLGQTYKNLGVYDIAHDLIRRAVELRTVELGETHPDTVLARMGLGIVHRYAGDYAKAEAIYQQLLECCAEGIHGDEMLNNLGNLYMRMGRYTDALEVHQAQLEERRDRGDPLAVAYSLNNMAAAQRRLGRVEDAEAALLECLDIRRKNLPKDDPLILDTMSTLAIVYMQGGRREESRQLLVPLLETERRVFGPEHPRALETMNTLALLAHRTGDVNEAESMHQQILETRTRVLGPEHPDTLLSLANLAMLYVETERYADAEPLLRRNLDSQQRVLGERHPDTLWTMSDLAQVYRGQGKFDDAVALHRDVLNIRRADLGTDHLDTRWALKYLADTYLEAGDADAARPFVAERLAATLRIAAAKNASASDIRLAAHLLLNCEPADLRDPPRAIELLEPLWDPESDDDGLLRVMALAAHANGRVEEAIALLQRAIERMEAGDRRAEAEQLLADWLGE